MEVKIFIQPYEIYMSSEDLETHYNCNFNNCKDRFLNCYNNRYNFYIYPEITVNDKKVSKSSMNRTINYMIKIVENEQLQIEQDQACNESLLKMLTNNETEYFI